MKLRFFLFLLLFVGFPFINGSQSYAQILNPVQWSFSINRLNDKEADLVWKATIEKDWHLYSHYTKGTLPTDFKFDKSVAFQTIGNVIESKSTEQYEKDLEATVKFFADNATFKQRIKILSKIPFTIKGTVYYQSCKEGYGCIPGNDPFSFKLDGAKTADDNPVKDKDTVAKVKTSKDTVASKKSDSKNAVITNDKTKEMSNMTLWAFFITALLGGFFALLTPCIYPMIPMTITYFMHGNKKRHKAILHALVYGLSIIVIYVLIGTIVSITLGESFTNWLSTHWLPNILFFIIFTVFAASFLGMFELTLPGWLVNKSDKQADKGGYIGSFFMAFTLVLVSFSCTAPIVGAILALSTQGEVIRPIIGMLGFSLAFAVPFTLFAIFPAALEKLPKSGGWLNSVKVVLGFIELALGLKFLSVADQTYHWGILDREIYLAFWIVIFFLMGIYLLGKLKFAHDSEIKHLGVPRLLLAIITFTFVVYLIPGMFGAPLKALSGWLPPQATHDFDLAAMIKENGSGGENNSTSLCEEPKYGDQLHLPPEFKGYFDYKQALACSKKQNKPVFIDFTGHGCLNCREMEANVWSDPKVSKRLKSDFIVVALYVDDHKIELPDSEWVTGSDGSVKKTLGEANLNFEITRFKTNAQPFYFIVDSNGEFMTTSHAYDLSVDHFVDFLDSGLKEFNKRNSSSEKK